jgi:hypothetical protein
MTKTSQAMLGAFAIAVLGAALTLGGYVWSVQPTPPADGANIGAGLLAFLGIAVVAVGLLGLAVTAVVAVLQRRSHV